MRLLFLSFMAIQSVFVSSRLYFKIYGATDGSTRASPKDKDVRDMVCEDSFHTTPFGFALADGVSGVPFPTTYFAQLLTNKISQAFLESKDRVFREKQDFNRFVSSNIVKEIDVYNRKLSETRIQKLMQVGNQVGHQVNLPFEHFSASATFIAAQIENHTDENANLNVFQKGDSSLVIFRRKKHSGKINAYHYVPVYMTEEQSYSFNMPYQFSNLKESAFNQISDKVKILKGDIVIAGSDGLFDNMALGFLTYLVNYLLSEVLLDNLTKENTLQKMEKVVLQFLEKLVQESEQIEKFAQSLIYQPNQSNHGLFDSLSNLVLGICSGNRECKSEFDFFSEEAHTVYVPFPIPNILSQNKNSIEFTIMSKINYNSRQIKSYTDHIQRNRNAFFECGGNEILWQNYRGEEETPLISRCVSEAISDIFVFNEKQFNEFEQTIDPRLFSQAITTAAKVLSVFTKHNYTPFFFKKIFATNQMEKEGGKPDDITTVVGLVVDEQPAQYVIEVIAKELETAKLDTLTNLAEDINEYINNKFKSKMSLTAFEREEIEDVKRNLII